VAKKMQSAQIDHYDPRAVFRGLFDGDNYLNRVAGACVYQCPRCRHQIRFRWRSFYQADGRSAFKGNLRRCFDDMTPVLSTDEQGFLDFFCPTCSAPTRVIFSAHDYTAIAYHLDIYAALVGAGTPRP